MRRWQALLRGAMVTTWAVMAGLGCHAEAARGATAPVTEAGDRAAGRPLPAPADGGQGGATGEEQVVDLSEPVMGHSQADVRSRRGPPSEIRGHDWIYTPDQEGCREVIVSEVLTFNEKGVVVGSHVQRRQTGKVCRRRDVRRWAPSKEKR